MANLKLYELSPTSTAVTELLLLSQVDNLTHTTRIPGGFWTLSFRTPMTDQKYWDWRINRILYRVVLEGQATQTLWEGRLEDISGPINSPTLTFRGYWSNFEDAVDNNKTYSKSFNATADTILKSMLDNGFHADTVQVDVTDQTNIAAMGPTIDQTYPIDWSLWRCLTDTAYGVLTYAATTATPWAPVNFAVWENRISHLTARAPTTVTWNAYLHGQGGVKSAPLRTTWKRLSNAISVLYNVSGSESQGAVSSNAASISKLIRREQVIPNVGESGATPAGARADAELARKQDIQQELDTLVITRVWDANGAEQSICMVRAGDVIRIPDLIPTSVGLGSVALDALRTFVIEEATCNHSRGELVIRPDRSSRSLAALLSRAHIP